MKKLIFLLLFLSPLLAAGQVIVTVAGTGPAGYNGDGIPATNAELYHPYGVALDDSGNLYICDYGNERIRKVNPAYYGIITTIAGNGTTGYSGDGGLGIYAEIGGPYYIAVDHRGNVYFPDGGRIRKITVADTITTIIGMMGSGFSGDGGPATAAQLLDPAGLTVDSIGNLYFADVGNYRIRKIDTAGIITTIAGTGVAGFSPDGSLADTAKLDTLGSICIDKVGNLFYEEDADIRKIDTAGIITTVAGNGIIGYSGDGGMATAAELGGGTIAIDSSGNLFIADADASRIREVNTAGIIYTIAGGGTSGLGDGGNPLLAELNGPQGVAVGNNGDVYIGDVGNNRVRLVTDHPLGVAYPRPSPSEREVLQLWPNPSDGVFSLFISSNPGEHAQISIINIFGEKVKEFSATTNEQVNVQLYVSPGIYYLLITTSEKAFNEKIIIQ